MGLDLGNLNPLQTVFNLGKTIIERVVPDKVGQAASLAELEKMQLSGELAGLAAQTDINKIEAASPNWFIAGGRPSVIWVCSAALASDFILRPYFIWFSALIGHPTDFPSLDVAALQGLLMALLGLSAGRTVEKIKNAAGNH
jgi:hypothetical protein